MAQKRICKLTIEFKEKYHKGLYDYRLIIEYYFDRTICGHETIMEVFYIIDLLTGKITPLKATLHNFKEKGGLECG